MKKALPIGVSDFRDIIMDNGYYVDKTLLIADWLQTIRGNVTLLTRPRRFGKTLNMTMLREFFDLTRDSGALFKELEISKTHCMAELNQWPVIFLSFKDCKGGKLDSLLCIMDLLLQAFDQLPKDITLEESDSVRFKQIRQVLLEQNIERVAYLNRAIYFLSKLLYDYYHKKVIILIDEYDTPMLSAYEQGYYEGMHYFLGSLYGSALKDNPYLERAMLTGIHRIAKENIFSGLNNLSVCTVMTKKYQRYFGLTPEETEKLLAYYDLSLNERVKAMYDGYLFGSQKIYNPWSIINYGDTKKMAPYWVNTASNELLVQVMLAAGKRVWKKFEKLLSQGKVLVGVDLQTSFFELNQPGTLWGLFLNSGYLTVTQFVDTNDLQVEVQIPNQEVLISFRKIVERYGGFEANSLDDLFSALLRKDIVDFTDVYEEIILTCTSFHDGSTENAYHMLFLGMCVYLDSDYRISSNIEQGHGRADILLEAKRPGIPSFVIEFKQGEDIEKLAEEAMEQIHRKKYYASLKGEILLLGIVHHMKQCRIVAETIEQ